MSLRHRVWEVTGDKINQGKEPTNPNWQIKPLCTNNVLRLFLLVSTYLKLRTREVWFTQELGSPPRLAEESKPFPAQKVKKESSAESPGESPRVLADPPYRVKNESPGDSQTASPNSPVFWLGRLVFDSVGQDFWRLARRLSRRLFFDFWAGEGFDWMRLFCLELEASCLQWSFSTHSWQF